MYVADNVFAKILRGELMCRSVLETPHALVFHDAYPTHDVHLLVIPKGPYTDLDAFLKAASEEEQKNFWDAVQQAITWVRDNTSAQDMRCLTNIGPQAGQTIFHFHLHILGGQPLRSSCET